MASGQKVTWDCVYLGSYPQTEVASSDAVYSSLAGAIWDANGDATVEGVKYRRISRDDATYSGYWPEGSADYRYFRYESVKWRVLSVSGDSALAVADVALDNQRYNLNFTGVTWETCSLRSWLNGYGAQSNQPGQDYSTKSFVGSVFSEGERSAVLETGVVNDDNIEYGTPGGSDTCDKVFLLSESEVVGVSAAAHGFASSYDTADEARWCKASDFAHAMGAGSSAFTSEEYYGNCWWWLRSPSSYAFYASVVIFTGWVFCDGDSNVDGSEAVRPALNLDLSSPYLTYAGTVSSDGTSDDGPSVQHSTSTGKRSYPDYGNVYTPGGQLYRALQAAWKGVVVQSSGGTFSALSPQQLARRYGALRDFTSADTLPVPGLSATNLGDYDWCDAMTPQGVCTTDDYLLVTAYCSGCSHLAALRGKSSVGGNSQLLSEAEENGHHAAGFNHPPVVYVLDKSTGRYLTTLVLDGAKSGEHAGGIASAGGYVWVARSGNGKKSGDVAMLRIPESTVKSAVAQGKDCVHVASSESESVTCPGSANYMAAASFATSYAGLLWVGYFSDSGLGSLVGFSIDGDGELTREKVYRIPEKANGATFMKAGGREYLMVNQSHGRNSTSHAYLYDSNVAGVDSATFKEGDAVKKFSLPPLLEEACYDGGKVYTVYESGASTYSCVDGDSDRDPYKNRCQSIVDYICVGNASSIASSSATGFCQDLKNKLAIACPVDVEVYSSAGDLVCRIAGDVVDGSVGDGEVGAEVVGGVKYLDVPEGRDYRVVVTPTAAGAMDVTFTENDGAGVPMRRTLFDGLALAEGEAYTVLVNGAYGGEAESGGESDDGPGDGDASDGGSGSGDAVEPASVEVLSPDGRGLEPGSVCDVATLAQAEGSLSSASHAYDGKAFGPELTGLSVGGQNILDDGGYALEYRDGSGAAISAPRDAGSYELAVVASGGEGASYAGELALPFEITPAKITSVSLKSSSAAYDGKAKSPSVTSVRAGSLSVPSSGFAVTYLDPAGKPVPVSGVKAAGTYQVKVTGAGNYVGTKTATFTVKPASVAKAVVSLSKSGFTYNGKAVKPSVKSVKLGSKALGAKSDYEVSYLNASKKAIAASGVKAAGTYYVKVSGRGNYTGSVAKKFTIARAANPMSVAAKTAAVKRSKKAQSVKAAKAYSFKKKAAGAVTYARVAKGSSKWLSAVNKKTGAITVKAGAPKGKTYTVKVKVSAAGNANYKPVSKTIAVKVKVK